MRHFTIAGLVIASTLITTRAAEANCPRQAGATLQDKVENWVKSRQPGTFFGLCALAVDGTGSVGFACGGKADANTGLDKDTLFQIGSVTKVFTAALFAKRVAQGRYAFQTALDPLLPPLFRRYGMDPIKLVELATHRSGLRRDAGEYLGPTRSLQLLDTCFETNCLYSWKPYHYSNWAFQILGYTLAYQDGYGVDGWFRDLDDSILQPLSMSETKVWEEWLFDRPNYFNNHAASGHTINASGDFVDEGTVPHPRCFAGTANPSGCLYSSARDMQIFLEYMMGRRTPSSTFAGARNRMRLILADGDQADNPQGLGWTFDTDSTCHEIDDEDNPRVYTRVRKDGGVIGQSAWIEYLIDPENPNDPSPLGIVVMANSEAKGTQSFDGIATDLLSKLPVP